MTCQKCRVRMKEEQKNHICHNQRKFRCPICKRARMQKHKLKGRK